MNLLVTSLDKPSSYAILASLRTQFEEIVTTVSTDQNLTRKSRWCSKQYSLPVPLKAWVRGQFTEEVTVEEQQYFERLRDICVAHRVAVVYPGLNDPEILLLAKLKPALAERGITAVVPDLAPCLNASDKWRAITHALQVGFPVPKSFLCRSKPEVDAACAELGFPLVIKARYSTGSRRVAIVHKPAEVQEELLRVKL
jgi:biotin carboxylase